jgi:GMP synthase (glutamine-hydrolysing)
VTHDKILILDFGSQYTQLIARRVRELNVFCEIQPFTHYREPRELPADVRGVILSGSPASVTQPDAPKVDLGSLLSQRPLLGLCYGAQLMAAELGGRVAPSASREYGRAELRPVTASPILEGLSGHSQVWMSHADTILEIPTGSTLIATTDGIPVAAFEHRNGQTSGSTQPFFGLQFHPEVTHTTEGKRILSNFVLSICGCKPDWTAAGFVAETVAQLSAQVGPTDQVVCALSGGVDSTVAAVLLQRAIGKRLHCVFVDTGLLRHNEYADVLTAYQALDLQVHGVNAKELFFRELAGVEDPEQKRKIIGRLFIEVFDAEAKKLTGISYLAQGTIYPDVIESAPVMGPSVTIKSHHNVGGLPERMKLKIVEPLRMLFKDEVRRVGAELGIPATILGRHPFPGPGLAIRILGEITPERVELLQRADHVFITGLRELELYDQIWQAFAVLLPVRSVGVMGDERTYENVLALRAVTSIDGMTADWARLPHDAMAELSNRIINQVRGINRVVYDISSKPPATIEWE